MISLALALTLAADGGVSSGAPLELWPEVRALYDVVTCQTDAGSPAIAAYCKRQGPRFKRFKEHWGQKAQQFLQSVEPAELPPEVVYPFGGGDLMMALVTFPKAQVITTLSLELAGDPRRLKAGLDDAKLKKSFEGLLEASGSTLTSNDSKSVNLSAIQQGDLPGQLSMHLMGLMLNGYAPVSARYFRIEGDGALHYFSQAEVDAMEGTTAAQLKASWHPPDFSEAFANVELGFVPLGEPNAKPRIFRHIGANLSNAGLEKTPGIVKHLESKGTVAAMTKAASYLLWREEFSVIRGYLTGHARFMISDSTGVLPRFWAKGCTAKTYGAFDQTFLRTWEVLQTELKREFAKQSRCELSMRFGYPDGSPEKKSHLFTVECTP
ncbi:MAG: hypothetical protein IPJ65_17390 [Archangiaceae bacterium]|nr:hypothetical protein [Archangiaceae bacterium]